MNKQAVECVEVGPRDGLQNESALVATANKVELIRRAIAYGARRIEVASFVNPRKVPQMADAEEVVATLGPVEGVVRIGLALNLRGAERALSADLEQVGAVAVASDEFGIRNQGMDCAASVAEAQAIVARAKSAGRTAQVTIATAFGCPFSGDVPSERVAAMAVELARSGPVEIALADTIGVAGPGQVAALVSEVASLIAPIPVRVHFHDTRNTANANIWAAIGAGAQTFDSSLGGLGGCPFAPGAAGNVATEDAVYMLERSGISTGLNLSRILDASRWLAGVMGRDLPAKLARAGGFAATGGSAR